MSLITRTEPRKISFTKNINPYAAGSVIAEFGNTKVHITATVEENVPGWMRNSGKGWITAEYNMLPGSTHTRSAVKEIKWVEERRKFSANWTCIKTVVDLEKLGERSVTIDCDVLVADGGTRTTSVSGAYVALEMAMQKLMNEGKIKENPLRERLGALSVGINKEGKIIADLNYEEDSSCETDMNIVMTKSGKFVELQGTAEGEAFSYEHY